MPLEFRKQRDGRLRKVWFGRFEANGKRYCLNLGVKIAGTPPASISLTDEGDVTFERSRATAQAKLDNIVEEVRRKRHAADLVEMYHEIDTGEQIKSVTLDEVANEWDKIPRHHKPSEKYAGECRAGLVRFVKFVRKEFPKAEDLAQVNRTVARAFLDAETKRGVTGRTWNGTLHLLRSTCNCLMPAGSVNPFSNMPTKETNTMFRKPFSPEELKAIVEVAKDDDFIRPLLVVGMCTAMRRGDCCLLKWKDVDMARRFITVKTAKTGVTVSIPIFAMLYDELRQRSEDRGQRTEGGNQESGIRGQGAGLEGYVFPKQAQMYLENPDGITWRAKKVLAVALGRAQQEAESKESGVGGQGTVAEQKPEGGGQKPDKPKALPVVPDEEARRRGREYIAKVDNPEKRERMQRVFELYLDGKTFQEVVEATGVSKGSASHYLNEVELAVKCRIVRGRKGGSGLSARLRNDSELLRAKREGGKRRASVRDFHSFRVTWVTLALTAGVPLELVQKVTGHKTTDIVLKHYFQPGREAFRKALSEAMPKLLTYGREEEASGQSSVISDQSRGTGAIGQETGGGSQETVGKRQRAKVKSKETAAKDGTREMLERLMAKASKKDKARLLELLGKL